MLVLRRLYIRWRLWFYEARGIHKILCCHRIAYKFTDSEHYVRKGEPIPARCALLCYYNSVDLEIKTA